MGLCDVPGGGFFCDTAGDAVSAAATAGFTVVAKAFATAANSLVQDLLTFWVRIPSPDLSGGLGSPVLWMQQRLSWVTGAVGVAAMFAVAVQILRRGSEGGRRLGEHLGRIALVYALSTSAISLLLQAGDGFSTWILGQVDAPKGLGLITITEATNPGLMFTIGLISILSSLVQTMLMLVRGAMLVLLTAVLPTTVFAAGSETGLAALRRQLSWVVAFGLYKPVAAIIYALAFQMINTTSSPGMGAGSVAYVELMGVLLTCMGVVALPALMRLVAPAVMQATSGGGGGSAAMAGIGAVATGAISLSSRKGGGGGITATPNGGVQPSSGTASTGAGRPPAPRGSSPGLASGAPASAGGAGAGTAAAGSAGPAGAVAVTALQVAQGARKAAQGAATQAAGED